MSNEETIRRWTRAAAETRELLRAGETLMVQRAELQAARLRILRDFVAAAGDFCANLPPRI